MKKNRFEALNDLADSYPATVLGTICEVLRHEVTFTTRPSALLIRCRADDVVAGHNTNSSKTCSCPTRVKPPSRPQSLPVRCTPENIPAMKQWLLDRFASSTFNKCPHQKLPLMEGPPIKIMIDPNATPVVANTPATVPLHWMEEVAGLSVSYITLFSVYTFPS